MQLSTSIVVPQDIRQVWRFLGDPLTAPSWDRSVAQVVPLSTAPAGVGYEAMTVAPSGKRQRFRITRYDTERERAFVLLESRLFRRAELSFQLDRVPDGKGERRALLLTVLGICSLTAIRPPGDDQPNHATCSSDRAHTGAVMLTVAAPSGSGGTWAAVTDGGGSDMLRASIRRYGRQPRLWQKVPYLRPNKSICAACRSLGSWCSTQARASALGLRLG